MWEASLNLAISIQSSSSVESSSANGRLAPPNLAVVSLGRSSSSDKAPASSKSFMIGLRACTKASDFLLGTLYRRQNVSHGDDSSSELTGLYLDPPTLYQTNRRTLTRR